MPTRQHLAATILGLTLAGGTEDKQGRAIVVRAESGR